MNTTDFKKRITKANVKMVLDHPFFAILSSRLPNVLDKSVDNFVTDGQTTRWNPEYVEGLNEYELAGALAKAVSHAAFGHCWRRGGREGERWQTACDKAVTGILKESGFTLPPGATMPTGSEVGKAAEGIYNLLPAAQPPQQPSDDEGQGDDKGSGGGTGGAGSGEGTGDGTGGEGDEGDDDTGDDADGDGEGQGNGGSKGSRAKTYGACGQVAQAKGSATEQQEAQQEWKIAVAQAALAAQMQGTLPGGLKVAVTELVEPKIDYAVMLRDFLQRTARNDYSWSKPNPRHFGRGLVLPSLISDELPAIVLVVDTSGSTGPYLKQFAAEVSEVLACFDTTIHLVYADTRVAGSTVITREDLPLKLDLVGGGGTSFVPPFDWVEKEEITPAAMIYLTDGYGDFPTTEPDYPLIWIMTSDVVAPIGETVRMQ